MYTKEQVEGAVKSKGYVWFEDTNNKSYDVNIIGIRNASTGQKVTNVFDDLLTLSYKDETGTWKYHEWPATTDPGKKGVMEYHNVAGVARLVEGQYRGSHTIRLHQGKYEALGQAKNVKVYRVANKNIIYDENVRLGSHIERVLNIAKIDKGDLKLENKDVDMNDLLTDIVDSMSLQLQKRNASVELDLKAEQSIVIGDELHLSNVLFNLIDNANKYSPENPWIKISTFTSGKNLIILVSDKGIGMNRDQLSKIFDQFYRIPTGNRHDVKGFGLGLSYVSNIVKRLNGTIRVKSEKDVGSEFEISLPLKHIA